MLWLAVDTGRTALRAAGLAVALLAALGVLLQGGAPARGQGIQVDVTQCQDPNADPSTCQRSTEKVGGQPSAPPPAPRRPRRPAPAPRPAPNAPKPKPRPAPGTEVQTFDLSTGQGQVQTSLGSQAVNLALTVKPSPAALPKVDPQTKPDVSTNGGALPSTGAATNPFDFVSGDRALSQFAVPPFLVPIYVAAGRAYGVPWNVLASINQIETDFGRNLNVSSAGALGWMQFMPSTWQMYGVDASGDGVADPYNPVDAIYAAARYLKASGAAKDLRGAIFSYNHAGWYVDIVLKNAGVYGSLPEGLVAETGSLAFGRFPVRGKVSYGDDFRRAQIARRDPQGLWIDGRPGSAAIATQNVTVKRVLLDPTLVAALRRKGELPAQGLTRPLIARPDRPPSPARMRAGVVALDVAAARLAVVGRALVGARGPATPLAVSLARTLRTVPADPAGEQIAGLPKGYGVGRVPGVSVEVTDLVGNTYGYGGLDRLSGNVRPGSRLRGGVVIGRLSPHAGSTMLFSTRAAGGAMVDPRPLVDGYRLQETADFFHAVAPLGGSPFVRSIDRLAAAGIKGGSDRQLAQRVLNDPNLDIYACGRQDVAQGKIDRRTLGALLYLSSAGLKLGISALQCGHSFYTSGGGISAHSFGAAVDIWSFNGQPVIGNQGPGSLIEQAIKLMMKLQGAAQPKQLISLMSLGGPSFAMGDHADHLHIGYSFDPSLGLGRSGAAVGPVDFTTAGVDALKPGKVDPKLERRLSQRLGGIAQPTVLGRRGPGAVAVGHSHSEYRSEAARASADGKQEFPLRLQPTAAGAQIADVSVPAGARGDEAYAVGTVDGTARGWARRQNVVLAHRDGRWRLVGPPRDARGRAVNPHLLAVAAVAGGEGYAAGERGAIVSLHGASAPRLEPRVTSAKLQTVDAARTRGQLTGYAAGARGTVVRLSGGNSSLESAGSSATTLRDVTIAGGRVLAVGTGGSGGALFERGSGDWPAVSPEAPAPADASVRLDAVAARGGALWVVGGRVDSRTAGASAEQPFAARLSGGRWTTYCSVPAALVAVAELGQATTHSGCNRTLTPDPADSGAATDVSITATGVMIATSRGPQLLAPGSNEFRPVPGVVGQTSTSPDSAGAALALSSQGRGWVFDTQGRMARVVPAGAGSAAASLGDWQSLPWTARGRPAAVAVAPGGDRALAFGGGGAAAYGGGRWTPAGGFGFGLRDVAWAGPDRVMGLTEAGDLLRRDAGAWEIDGTPEARNLGSRLDQLVKLGQALGPDKLVPGVASGHTGAGLQALSFASADEGYAVGTGGTIERSDGRAWTHETSTTTEDLEAVAAGPAGAVAGGAHGTLLRRGDHGWHPILEAARLVGGQPFTAAAALPDGTFLAAAGGAILTARGDGAWQAADVAPLALPVERMSGYRDLGDRLHVLVLVNTGADKVLLDGDRNGWKPVSVPADLRVVDAQLTGEGGRLWVMGMRGSEPVVARIQPPARTVLGSGNFLSDKATPPIAARDKP